eukprot:CAMPEP_0201282748 /NCGR_PEP_ID=MMETSP1317-20130820/6555_1 /ASSEMBLY_ACC=CAM_ASM_000770 /TAXON_ID=187299 /ORGANISM="Undescribed Undescribed, Strain Undescribed" /LENGTH=37 /DNA_ID= /DNA_START= /DNA_END= /DNA_ORIENTATION=
MQSELDVKDLSNPIGHYYQEALPTLRRLSDNETDTDT